MSLLVKCQSTVDMTLCKRHRKGNREREREREREKNTEEYIGICR